MATAVTLILCSLSFITAPLLFFAANILWALCMSCFNISINSQSVILQNAIKKIIIGRFHGTWAIGAMLSAAFAGFLTTVVSIQVHYIAIAMLCLVAFIFASQFILNKDESHQAERTKKAPKVPLLKTPTRVWLLSFGFFAAVAPELALIDWSAIYSRDALGIADIGLRSVPYTAFMIFMIIGRLSLGRLTKIWHMSELATVGGFLSFAGLGASVLFAPNIAAMDAVGSTLVGAVLWAVAGLGCASLVPSFFSASGHVKGLDTATVMARMSLAQTMMIIVAKVVIGAVAESADIRIAFIIPVALLLICAFVARIFAKEARNDSLAPGDFAVTMPIAVVGE
jgi:MFS family permease